MTWLNQYIGKDQKHIMFQVQKNGHLKEKQVQMEYEIDKLYNKYSYERDSIIIEYNNKPN